MNVLTEPFHTDNGRKIPPLAEVWLPETAGPLPSVVITHGGGFLAGHRRMSAVRAVALHLVSLGFAVTSFDYRLAFRGGRLDEGVDDVRLMMAWWRKQADRFALDPERISMVGLSAGGALTLLAAPDVGPLDRVVSVYAPTDWFLIPGGDLSRSLLFQHRNRDEWEARSPKHFDLPVPLLVQQGTRDRLVKPEHARRLAARREAAGLPVEVRWYDAPHGWLRHRDHPEFSPALHHLGAFLSAA